jgi:hypothetical protein
MESNLSNTSRKVFRLNFFRVAIILVLLLVITQPVLAAFSNPRVFPPNSKPYGKSYGEWGGEWWKYVLSYPLDISPLNDPTGANCGMDQSGPVFFLVGTTGGAAVRDECIVPSGKALFFPLVNIFGAVPEDAANSQDLRDLVSWVTNYIDEITVSVDGVPLQNLWNYRFESPFSFTGAVDNPFDQNCGTPGTCYEGYHEIGFSDGYWIMMPPLPAGEHTINFGGHFNLPDWGWEFEVDVTYNLTVAKPGLSR